MSKEEIYVSYLKDNEELKKPNLFTVQIGKAVFKKLGWDRTDKFMLLFPMFRTDRALLVKSENGHPIKRAKNKYAYEFSFYSDVKQDDEFYDKECYYFIKQNNTIALMFS